MRAGFSNIALLRPVDGEQLILCYHAVRQWPISIQIGYTPTGEVRAILVDLEDGRGRILKINKF
jgi:hypothetical protein